MCTKYCQDCPHEGIAIAIADSLYRAGVTAGWNAANSENPNSRLAKLLEYEGHLRPIFEHRQVLDGGERND